MRPPPLAGGTVSGERGAGMPWFDDLMWFESVPSGGRWFCTKCKAKVPGYELDGEEAYRAMVHDDGCPVGDRRSSHAAGEGGA